MLLSMDKESKEICHNFKPVSRFDEWIISRCAAVVADVNNSVEHFELHLATQALKKYFYGEICDTYLVSVF